MFAGIGKSLSGGGGAEPPGAIPCEASAVEFLRLRCAGLAFKYYVQGPGFLEACYQIDILAKPLYKPKNCC
jgi:hypothetical protein